MLNTDHMTFNADGCLIQEGISVGTAQLALCGQYNVARYDHPSENHHSLHMRL